MTKKDSLLIQKKIYSNKNKQCENHITTNCNSNQAENKGQEQMDKENKTQEEKILIKGNETKCSKNNAPERKKENKEAEVSQNSEEKGHKKGKNNKKKKIRRSNKIKNTFRDFKIFYQNVRGLKSKIDSPDETINDWEPSMIYLVETHMSPEEQIDIPGHQIYRNDGTKNSKGILIAVKNNIKNVEDCHHIKLF